MMLTPTCELSQSGLHRTAASPAYDERGLVFDCKGDSLLAVVCEPRCTVKPVGVVIIVGGPQYRAGSHRQFVLLSRHLAHSGYTTLRFDVRGMGDSDGNVRDFTELDDDVGAAIAALFANCPQLRRVVLWGLCDGASAALLYALHRQDERMIGMCLLNPWLRSETGLARTRVRHYYTRRLLQGSFWRKLIAGGVGGSALMAFWRSLRKGLIVRKVAAPATADPQEDFQSAMARAWLAFPGPILLVLSGKDYTAKEFLDGVSTDPAWRGALSRTGVQRADLADADHTFSGDADRLASERVLTEWLDRVIVGSVGT